MSDLISVPRMLLGKRDRLLSVLYAPWMIELRKTWPTIGGTLFALACVVLLWRASLQAVDPSRMTDLGLVSVLPLSFYAALGTLTVSFGLALSQRQPRVPLLLLHVFLLILMIHGTPQILYGTLRYSWAWKHVGIVDYIQRHGSVNPNIPVLGVYHNWPGFFAVSALFTEVAGFQSALSFAGWGPVFFNLLDLGALLLILQTFTRSRQLTWLSIWFFYLTNWIGQDYFSPQALNYFFHLVILGICLRWFKVTALPSKPAPKKWAAFDRAASIYHHVVSRAVQADEIIVSSRPYQRVGLMSVVILLSAVVAFSHQLTPFMTLTALILLVVFQRFKVRSLPLLVAALTLTWFAFGAVVFLRAQLGDILSSIGRLTGNLDSNLINVHTVSSGQRLVAFMSRGLTAFLWGLALLGFIRRLRQGYWDLACVLLAIAPFSMLVWNSYGGEMLFRAYFFALPFMAFLAASSVYPSPTSGNSRQRMVVTILLSGALLVGFCFAYYGKDQQFYFTSNEVDAAEYLYDRAPEGALLIEGSSNWPSRFKNYERFTYVPIALEPKDSQINILEHPAEVLSRWMREGKYSTAYVLITRSQKADVDTLGEMPVGSLDRIEQALMQSQDFRLVYQNRDAKIFIVVGCRTHSEVLRGDCLSPAGN